LKTEAKTIFEGFYDKITRTNHNGRIEPFIQRLQIYTLKFAMIVNVISELNLRITGESMAKAVDMMWSIYNDLIKIDRDELVFGKVQANMKRLSDCLEKHGKQTRSFLLNYTKLTTKEFSEAVENLIAQNRISLLRLRTSGRSVEYFDIKKEESYFS